MFGHIFFFLAIISLLLPDIYRKKTMLTNVYGARCLGIEAIPVTVEVDMTAGIGIHLTGLADTAVKESLLRTISALQFLGYRIPGRKIVINLAPADIKKKGSGFDLPIAAGIIAVSGQEHLPMLSSYIMMGELGLDGSVRSVPGALPIVELAMKAGAKGCILPEESAMEASEFTGINVYGIRTLAEAIRIISGAGCEDLLVRGKKPAAEDRHRDIPDFADIYGQEGAKRGLEIAAAGGHNVIMIGPPGSGKSTLAKAIPGIMPEMDTEEALQTSKIYSVAGKGGLNGGLMRQRPFRAPHYSTSLASLIGGGTDYILPGEVSLAHNGVLFLDEFLEIPKKVSEALRSPLEDRKVTISRLRTKIEFPASFMLVAATNPCPCGYYGEGDRCTCTPGKRAAYLGRLSGPIADRIDIHLWIHQTDSSRILRKEKGEPSSRIAERVVKAKEIQKRRFMGEGIFCNAEMNLKLTELHCGLSPECSDFLSRTARKMNLSGRACTRILKLARTIADLEGAEDICIRHISEAAGYRFLDRQPLF